MSLANNRRGRLQALIAAELLRQLPRGTVINEASILTDIGVRVTDVVWCSLEFFHLHREVTPYPNAPEICVEIVSPSNSVTELQEKTRAYLAAGAKEVWQVSEKGRCPLLRSTRREKRQRICGHCFIAAVRVDIPRLLPEPRQ